MLCCQGYLFPSVLCSTIRRQGSNLHLGTLAITGRTCATARGLLSIGVCLYCDYRSLGRSVEPFIDYRSLGRSVEPFVTTGLLDAL